jgi:peptide/nickel transport system permease protein
VAAVGGGGLPAYALRRLLLAVPVLFGVSVLVFAVLHLAPGDPAAIMLGAQATKEDVARLHRDLGLDQPLVIQYARWMGQVLQGDLGRSIPLGRAVLPEVLLRFKATLVLTGGALLIAILLGLAAGIVSAVKQYTWLDRISMGVAVTGVSLPVFWTGIMLILLFALQLRWFPSSGMSSPYGSGIADVLWHLVLPAVTLGTASAAALARLTRSSVSRSSARTMSARPAPRAWPSALSSRGTCSRTRSIPSSRCWDCRWAFFWAGPS